jgi:hypothetical protein
LRCVSHKTSAISASAPLRAEVVLAYGGECSCGSTEALWIMPDPGTEVPRYPGGRKMGSVDKYRWLRKNGFPSGWSVRCAGCALIPMGSSIL